MQAYIQRLKEVERSCSEVRERGVSAQQKLSDEWGAWMEMLCSCARQLQSRADAGEERAQIGSMETPAAAVLETAHRLITECGMLRNVGRKFDTKEAALKDKFEVRGGIRGCAGSEPTSRRDLGSGPQHVLAEPMCGCRHAGMRGSGTCAILEQCCLMLHLEGPWLNAASPTHSTPTCFASTTLTPLPTPHSSLITHHSSLITHHFCLHPLPTARSAQD